MGFSLSVCHFSNAVFSRFPKKSQKFHVLARHFFLVMSSWCVEGLSFLTVSFYWSVVNVRSDSVGFCVSWAAQAFLQYTEDGNSHSSVYQHVLTVFSLWVCFYWHPLLDCFSVNSLFLPFQLAQSKDTISRLCIVSEVSGVHLLCFVLY